MDDEPSTTMSEQEWAETLQRHSEAQAQRYREVQAAKAETASERQVRDMYEQNRPTLDPATQALWDAWCKRICHEMIQSALDQAADEIRTQNEVSDKITDDQLKNHVKAIHKLRTENETMRKEFAAEITKLKKDFSARILKISKAARGQNVIDLPNPLVRKA